MEAPLNSLLAHCTTKFNPIQTGGGGGGSAPTIKIRNFQTVEAMTPKFGDFSENLFGNIFTPASLVYRLCRFHDNHILKGTFYQITIFFIFYEKFSFFQRLKIMT